VTLRAAIFLVAALAGPALADEKLALQIFVTEADGAPVADRATIATLVEEVGQLFHGSGLCFSIDLHPLPKSADLLTVRDRHAFAKLALDRAINIFLVRSIKDPDPDSSTVRAAARAGRTPSGWLNGAEIPRPGRAPDLYLVVRIDAGAKGFAHELGHFFGEGHSAAPDNLMSYSLDRTRFDEHQLRTFRARAAKHFREGTLTTGGTCPSR
jgi:hypothetical protein